MNRKSKPTIQGYTDQLSVKAGDQIGLHISTDAERYSVEIARVGAKREVVWTKEGLPGEECPVPENCVSHGCNWPLALKVPVPEHWKSGYYSVTLHGSGLGSGHGSGRSNQSATGQSATGEMSFVVRAAHPGRDSKILLQRSTNTDNAYNTWGGADLYRGADGPARRVSFDRPFAGFAGFEGRFLFSIGAECQADLEEGTISPRLRTEFSKHGVSFTDLATITTKSGQAEGASDEQTGTQWHILEPAVTFRIQKGRIQKGKKELQVFDGFSTFQSCWANWERPFVEWAERAGYRFDYAVNSDLEFHPEILQHYRLVLSVGHDEYWSSPMRDHLEAFIAGGGNVAFLSGNVVYWQVRSEDGGHALVCWKEAYKQDPYYKSNPKLLTTLWCSRLINRPENQLTGVSYAYGGYHRFFDQFRDGSGAYTVHRPNHWIFEGTGLRQGDLFGAANKIVGYECDGCLFELQDGLPVATHRDGTPDGFQILATGPAGLCAGDGSLGWIQEALYGDSSAQHPQPGAAVLGAYTRGGTVVTAGSTNWSDGLRGGDKVVERITRNILDRLSS